MTGASHDQEPVIDWLESKAGQNWSRERAFGTRSAEGNLAHRLSRSGIFADIVEDHPEPDCDEHPSLLLKCAHHFKWQPGIDHLYM